MACAFFLKAAHNKTGKKALGLAAIESAVNREKFYLRGHRLPARDTPSALGPLVQDELASVILAKWGGLGKHDQIPIRTEGKLHELKFYVLS